MSLDKIIAITGKSGLYKLITQTRGGFVAESLADKKRLSISIQQNVSVLSEIAIYTLTKEVPLKNVFQKIKDKENGQKTTVKPKDSKDKLEAYFFDVLPDYDEDRVYASDIKKVIQWYNVLLDHNLLEDLETKNEADEVKEEAEAVKENDVSNASDDDKL